LLLSTGVLIARNGALDRSNNNNDGYTSENSLLVSDSTMEMNPLNRQIDVETGDNKDGSTSSLLPSGQSKSLEEPISSRQVGFWLFFWMANNILVTILNKAAFAKVDFKYPYALSTIHMACNIIGAQIFFLFSRTTKPKQIEASSRKSIFLFSIIFSLNIAIGNISLRWVSVNFNQVCRSLVPVVVMVISMTYYSKVFSLNRKWAIVPIVFGVALTFYGDMTFTNIGATYTMLCVLFAALKAILSGELLTGDLKLHPIDLLLKMCPLALVEIGIFAVLSGTSVTESLTFSPFFIMLFTGEVYEIMSKWRALASSAAPQVVLLSGILSFSLNVTSFIANKITSPLTLCIAANVKQVLLVCFGTLYFGDEVSLINGLGILMVIAGSFKYVLIFMPFHCFTLYSYSIRFVVGTVSSVYQKSHRNLVN
jgi:Triose-phosphate Transporter family